MQSFVRSNSPVYLFHLMVNPLLYATTFLGEVILSFGLIRARDLPFFLTSQCATLKIFLFAYSFRLFTLQSNFSASKRKKKNAPFRNGTVCASALAVFWVSKIFKYVNNTHTCRGSTHAERCIYQRYGGTGPAQKNFSFIITFLQPRVAFFFLLVASV